MSWRLHPTKVSVVGAVVRRLVPFLIEATVIPTALFYTFLAALGSVAIGRPLIARFAQDFCPLDAEVQERPGVNRLFRRLTVQWAFVNLALAAVILSLLWTVSTTVFVGAITVATWLITATGLCLTMSASVRTAKQEGLTTAVGSNGLLRAYTQPTV